MTIVETLDQPADEEFHLDRDELRAAIGSRAIVLVGMMGSGKSSVGKKLATRLGLPFVDADTEIETAAGMTIPEIFAQRGETEFRNSERRVIGRILTTRAPLVLATGGGAFMNAETRARIADLGISIWLKADLELLARRIGRKDTRPLVRGKDPLEVLITLAAERDPLYAQADIVVETGDTPHNEAVEAVVRALTAHLAGAET